jgi:hypothetical protein
MYSINTSAKGKLSKMESIKVLTWISVIPGIRYAPNRDFRAAAPLPPPPKRNSEEKNQTP